MSAPLSKPSLALFRRSRRSRSSILSCTHRLLKQSAHRRVRVPLATKYANGVELPLGIQPRLRLPRTLSRPRIGEVNASSIQAAYPELAGVPPEYIRDRLPMKGPHMLAALASLNAQAPTASLPKEMEVVMHDMVAADCPTHMLAVHANSPAHLSPRRKVTLYPVHQLVLVTNCANLPTLPHSSNFVAGSSTAALPVVPLCLPSPETYPLLQSYLYTKQPELLLSVLLPAIHCDMRALAQHAMFINGLWRNACALGVVDQKLWDVIDDAWGVVVDATEQATTSH